jgi:glycosyltransferase involved in cell wall biosynthesis
LYKVPSLSFFFPALNEEAHIEDLVRKAERLLPEIALAWEIIPVDDGSTDGTKAILQRLAAENPGHVRPVHHETNQGYGKALIYGFQNARYDLVFFTDGDRQFDLGELPFLIDKLDKGDLIAGFRMHRRDPLTRQLYGLLWVTLVNVLFGLNIRDVNCAFKLVKRSVIDRVKLSSMGAVISTELYTKAIREGFRIIQVGVTHYPRTAGRPTGAQGKVIVQAFRELFTLYKKAKIPPR